MLTSACTVLASARRCNLYLLPPSARPTTINQIMLAQRWSTLGHKRPGNNLPPCLQPIEQNKRTRHIDNHETSSAGKSSAAKRKGSCIWDRLSKEQIWSIHLWWKSVSWQPPQSHRGIPPQRQFTWTPPKSYNGFVQTLPISRFVRG